MRRRVYGALFALCSCTTLEGPVEQFQQPIAYGAITATLSVSGHYVDRNGRDGYFFALDSAIQGYGLQQMFSNGDSAVYRPVPPGPHTVTLRGVGPPDCAIVNGLAERPVDVRSGEKIQLLYFVTCIR